MYCTHIYLCFSNVVDVVFVVQDCAEKEHQAELTRLEEELRKHYLSTGQGQRDAAEIGQVSRRDSVLHVYMIFLYSVCLCFTVNGLYCRKRRDCKKCAWFWLLSKGDKIIGFVLIDFFIFIFLCAFVFEVLLSVPDIYT